MCNGYDIGTANCILTNTELISIKKNKTVVCRFEREKDN